MPAQYRVLVTDRAWPDLSLEREVLEPLGAELIDAPAADEATLIRLAEDVDAIATCWAQVTEKVIESAARCRIVARFGIGLDNIAVDTATRLGIPVTYVPDYCVSEVADHALALLLSCARKVAYFHSQTKAGTYKLQAGAPLRRLGGQVLGLIGFGRIARDVYRKATALGLEVIAHSLSGRDYDTGCRMVSLETLLQESDYVSLHLPMNDDTRGLLSASKLKLMKPTAYLINTSRGGLIDHDALASALENDAIAGAALDVFDPEPPDLAQPLFRDERVILTPHAAFLSEESLRELRVRTARQVAAGLVGERPEHVVNPQVYGQSD